MTSQAPVRAEPQDWLTGYRVVEVTIGVSSPLTSRALADLGADVIKVESRAKLDVNRARLPRRQQEGVPPEESFGLLHEANAGKRSMTLNLKTAEGRELLMRLLGTADVFVQNFAPGWMERLGMSIEQIQTDLPGLVILSAAGYGQQGPLRTQRAYAPVMTSLAGVEGVIGYEDGEVVGTMASALADMNASYVGAVLVQAALVNRRRTGRGRHIDLSQTEASALLSGEAVMDWHLSGTVPGPRGNSRAGDSPWHLEQHGRDAWTATVGEVSHPVVVDAEDVLVGAERARLVQDVSHPYIDDLTVTTLPWQLDGTVAEIASAAPLLGGDTAEVLRELGCTDEQIADLHEREVLL